MCVERVDLYVCVCVCVCVWSPVLKEFKLVLIFFQSFYYSKSVCRSYGN